MTRIPTLFGGRPTVSFEFSPPKDDAAEDALSVVLGELAAVGPAFASMTYGAGGSTRERTRDAVVRFNREQPFPTMPHLTCVGHTKDDIRSLLDAYAAAGIDNILALGGDPPADGSDPGGDFTYADELVAFIRAYDADFSIGVAAFPEKHPRSVSIEDDRRRLADKLAAADFAITQFFFEPEPYWRMLDDLAALGCEKPVLPGIMLFINVAGVRRMSAMNDATIPASMEERLDAADGDPRAVRVLGTDLAEELCTRLLERPVPGFHFYTMNRSVASLDLVDRLGLGRSTT